MYFACFPLYLGDLYPGPRGFLLFFLGKFCDAKHFFYYFFFNWHKALKVEKRKPLVKSIGILTFMPSAFDCRFWLEDILIALLVIWLDGLNIFGDVIGQKKMTCLTAFKCWASMKVRFSTILTIGFLFSWHGASIRASRRKFPNKKR